MAQSIDLPTIEEYAGGSVKFPQKKINKTPYNYKIWEALKPSENIEIFLLEDFESQLNWTISIKKAIETNTRFIAVNPITDKRNIENHNPKEDQRKFINDLTNVRISDKMFLRKETGEQIWAMELQCYFKKPGDDFVVLKPNRGSLNTFFIKNLAVSFALWVRSTNKKHRLYAIIADAYGRNHEIDMGTLDFYGWEQLNQFIPEYMRKRHKTHNNQYEFTFKGLKIQSDRHEEAGLFLVAFDLIMIATDHRFNKYGGSNIKDDF